jgi:hypothetical protein
VVVRRRQGLNGALRGSGLGPWMEAVIFRAELGAISVELEVGGVDGISR